MKFSLHNWILFTKLIIQFVELSFLILWFPDETFVGDIYIFD